MCTEYMDGGSLDTYGAIPEQVLGRITVSVSSYSSLYWFLVSTSCAAGGQWSELSVELEDHAPR